MSPRRWFMSASALVATVGAALLALILLLPFATVFAGTAAGTHWAVFPQAALEAGLLAGLLGAIRLRPTTDAGGRRLRRELGAGGLLAAGVWLGGSLSILLGTGLAISVDRFGGGINRIQAAGAILIDVDPWAIVVTATIFGAFAAVAAVLSFALGRGLLVAWGRWDRLRRTKLRWALTNSLLIVSLSVAVIIGGGLSVSAFVFGLSPDDIGGIISPESPWIERMLATVVFHYVPAGIVLFLASLVIGIVIVPPVAVIAFPVVGRATRRLEALTAATTAVRTGDLSARTTVTGEDEIARLQADFNAMAADLERTLGELREERDAVGRLLSARRELIASVSHELRTPLATLRGYLDSAMEHWDESASPTLRQDLEIMSGEAERLHRLVDDLFILSRAEVGRLPLTMQPTEIAPLLQRIVDAAVPLAWNRGRVEVVAQLPGELPPALVDAERLEQIVWNLITNAVRHTPPGGLVLVSAEPVADQLEIQVRDTGEGIDPAELPMIWDRFYRASNARDRAGAGLGLALVKEMTEAMGGTVAVESTPGEGSWFSIRLPGAAIPSPRPAVPSATH